MRKILVNSSFLDFVGLAAVTLRTGTIEVGALARTSSSGPSLSTLGVASRVLGRVQKGRFALVSFGLRKILSGLIHSCYARILGAVCSCRYR